MKRKLLTKKLKNWCFALLCSLVGISGVTAFEANPVNVTLNSTNELFNNFSGAEAGSIAIAGSGDTETTICVDGVSDPIAVTMSGATTGANSAWVITDTASGLILALPGGGPFDLDGAGAGVCSIWYLKYDDGLTGLGIGQNISGLTGCFDFSNPITVTRNDPEAGAISIAGTGATSTAICAGDGVSDAITVNMTGATSGTNSGWIITDNATGEILALPMAGPFDLDGAGAGTCDIWYIKYEDGLTGLSAGQNVGSLMGCYDLSNAITVNRDGVDAGGIEITGSGATETAICIDGMADPIAVTMTGTAIGDNGAWVITDTVSGLILALPGGGPFDLDGAGAGVCSIWYLKYQTGLTGLSIGQNISGLTGCFDFSNPITVTRNDPEGGILAIAGTGATSIAICAGDGAADDIAVDLTGTIRGTNGTYVITDNATGNILGLPATGPFNLDGAGAGVCDIWYLRYEDGLTGLTVGQNVSGLTGCFDLSNAITVNREGVDAGAIQLAGTADTAVTICVGEGTDDLISTEFVDASALTGTNGAWLITDNATGNILALPPAGPFNLEGAGTGVCDIWYLRYEDGLTGLTIGQNVSGLTGCFDLSNAITVNREGVDAGAIQLAGTTDTTVSICVGEGTDDLISTEFVDASALTGTNGAWLITDNATGNILALPPAGPFNLEGAGSGVCDIWYLRYEDGLTGLTVGQNVSGLTGCFDLSNAISVTRLEGAACNTLSIDEFSQDFNFSLYPNPTNNIVNIKYNGQSNLNLNIEVYDVLGKRIAQNTFNNTSNMSIDLNSFSNGSYFLNILDVESGNRTIKRVIKN